MPNEEQILLNLNYYYEISLQVLDYFGGPSIYFHTQCIKEQGENFLSNRHIELIYATLTAWGMHRMGKTKTKLCKFEDFKESIHQSEELLRDCNELHFSQLNIDRFKEILLSDIEEVYFDLKVSRSDSKIVGNSKTLAHLLPNLIPPIDRQYTIRFFKQ